MTDRVCFPGESLYFNTSSDLETYRVESALDKEPETIAWINSWDVQGERPVFYDIGANMGIYSLYAGYKHRNLDVFAFEPVSNNFASLLQSIWLNSLDNVHPFRIALCNESRLTSLYLSDTRPGNSGAQIDRAVNEKGEEYRALRVESVLGMSVDKIVRDFAFPLPAYIKIDVDGHEPDILKGMTETLSSPKLQSLLVEFNNDEEFSHWTGVLASAGLTVDESFDMLPNHSRIRRQKNGGLARNYIFSRNGLQVVSKTHSR